MSILPYRQNFAIFLLRGKQVYSIIKKNYEGWLWFMIEHQIRILRKQNGLTQQQVADVLGVSRSTYCNYESGARNASTKVIQKLIDFYKVSSDVFYKKASEEILNDEEYYEGQTDTTYLSQLSKKEKDLIVAFRCMNKTQKKSVETFMKDKLKENE